MTLEAIDPLPRTRRGWIILGILAVVILTAFVLVIRFYNAEGGSTVDGGVGATSQPAIIATLEPQTVDATQGTATFHITLEDQGSGLLGDDERLTKNIRLTVNTGLGPAEFRYSAGTVLGQAKAVIAIDGEEANYPFDKHSAWLVLEIDGYEKAADGAIVSTGQIPMGLQGTGGVNGWNTEMDLTSGLLDEVTATVSFDRAFSTQVFALLILFVAAVLGFLALAVGVRAFAGRHVAEAATLSWSAALLFALPALRNYLPNGPPFGASIDMYAFLWIMVAAGTAAVLLILAYSAHPERRASAKDEESSHAA